MPCARLASLLALAALALPSVGAAQAFTLNRFRPAETPTDPFHVSRPDALPHLDLGAQLHLDYAHDPLVYERTLGDADTEEAAVVAHQLVATAALALGIGDRLVLYTGLPVDLMVKGDDETFGAMAPEGSGVGDIYLGGRVRILGEPTDLVGLGAHATLTFPTGSAGDANYRGDAFLSFHPEVLFEVRPEVSETKQLRVTLNLGARIRENQRLLGDVLVGDELTWGLALTAPVMGSTQTPGEIRVDVHAQLFGAFTMGAFAERESTAMEALAGAKVHHPSGAIGGLAVGAGLQRGVGNPDARVVLMGGWQTAHPPGDQDGDGIPDIEDGCPAEPEDRDGFEDEDGCPDTDDDRDGILDVDDECPREPGLEVLNGCPDTDSDGDGILNIPDECPEQPEDFDEFDDEDGCLDADNDEDGVLDVDDQCPMEPGPAANHGCPDTDRDGDGVVDRLDNCPDEPGPASNQGCEEEQQVVIREDRLEILDRIYFATDRAEIRRRSYDLLRNIASVLENHPEIQVVRIEGHTDERGSRDYNMQLSQQRAEAVREFLVAQGIDGDRLMAHGFGETQPAEDADGHADNRRVEFNLGFDDGSSTTVEAESLAE